VIARIHRTAIDAVVFALLLALIAVRDVAGKALLHKVLKTGSIIGKFAVEIIDCVS